ncbi:MAG: AhpC/TSA family protein [Deltaproteobacteria bacterium]|nr:AhpC/TSA family protein [Deltaproteobacteria bacterium]
MSVRVGEQVPAVLADVEVFDTDGTTSRLGERWAEGPAALVFLRHFACLACTEHVTLLALRLHELTRLGVRVVYVGNGEPRYIEAFVERNAIDTAAVEVITDPTLAAHRALELHRSFMETYGPRALWGLGRALVGGFRQRGIEGDNYQQGGLVVVDAQQQVAYVHRDQATGDHAPLVDVIEAVMRVAAQGSPVV